MTSVKQSAAEYHRLIVRIGGKVNMSLKAIIKKMMHSPTLNPFIRGGIKLFRSEKLNDFLMYRVPILGKFSLKVTNSKKLILKSSGNDAIAIKLYWKGMDGFEPETFPLFRSLLKHSKTFFDIGANIGIYSLVAAVENPQIQVHAFEPSPLPLKSFKENLNLNNLKNIKIHSTAITNYDGEIKLFIPASRSIPTSSSTRHGFRENCKEITVPAGKLDSFVENNNIGNLDLIKIDTEGTEHLVFGGASNVLANHRPIIICEVLKGLTETPLQAVFDKNEYRSVWISGEGLIEKSIEGDPFYEFNNFLFIPKERFNFFKNINRMTNYS